MTLINLQTSGNPEILSDQRTQPVCFRLMEEEYKLLTVMQNDVTSNNKKVQKFCSTKRRGTRSFVLTIKTVFTVYFSFGAQKLPQQSPNCVPLELI